MTFRKHVMISFVLLAFAGLLAGCGSESITIPEPAAEAPMVAPANVNVQLASDGSVTISWSANGQSHLRGYNVYRHDVDASAIERLNAGNVSDTRFIDRSTEWGHTYEYLVTSVSVKGAESDFASAQVTVIEQRSGKERDTREN